MQSFSETPSRRDSMAPHVPLRLSARAEIDGMTSKRFVIAAPAYSNQSQIHAHAIGLEQRPATGDIEREWSNLAIFEKYHVGHD